MFWLILLLEDGSRVRYRRFPTRAAAEAFGQSVMASSASVVLGVSSFSVRRSRTGESDASDALALSLQWDWCQEVPF